MAWRQPNPNFPVGFREGLTYEMILREQVKVCLECFNAGDRDGLSRALAALFALITPRIQDSEFREDIDDLDDEWDRVIKVRERARRKQMIQARWGCPDLVPGVERKPSIEHLGRQLYTVLSLLERKKMGLKLEVEMSNWK